MIYTRKSPALLIIGVLMLLWGALNQMGSVDGLQGWLNPSPYKAHQDAVAKYQADTKAAADKAAAEGKAAPAAAPMKPSRFDGMKAEQAKLNSLVETHNAPPRNCTGIKREPLGNLKTQAGRFLRRNDWSVLWKWGYNNWCNERRKRHVQRLSETRGSSLSHPDRSQPADHVHPGYQRTAGAGGETHPAGTWLLSRGDRSGGGG